MSRMRAIKRSARSERLDRETWAGIDRVHFEAELLGRGEYLMETPLYFGRAFDRPPLFRYSATGDLGNFDFPQVKTVGKVDERTAGLQTWANLVGDPSFEMTMRRNNDPYIPHVSEWNIGWQKVQRELAVADPSELGNDYNHWIQSDWGCQDPIRYGDNILVDPGFENALYYLPTNTGNDKLPRWNDNSSTGLQYANSVEASAAIPWQGDGTADYPAVGLIAAYIETNFTNARTGSRYAVIKEGDSGPNMYWGQFLACHRLTGKHAMTARVAGGDSWDVEIWAKTKSGSASCKLEVSFYDFEPPSDGSYYGDPASTYQYDSGYVALNSSTWTKVSVSGTVPSGADSSGRYARYMYVTHGVIGYTDDVWFDTAKLSLTSSSPASDDTTSWEISNEKAWSGKHSAKLVLPNGGLGPWLQTFNPPASTYKHSSWPDDLDKMARNIPTNYTFSVYGDSDTSWDLMAREGYVSYLCPAFNPRGGSHTVVVHAYCDSACDLEVQFRLMEWSAAPKADGDWPVEAEYFETKSIVGGEWTELEFGPFDVPRYPTFPGVTVDEMGGGIKEYDLDTMFMTRIRPVAGTQGANLYLDDFYVLSDATTQGVAPLTVGVAEWIKDDQDMYIGARLWFKLDLVLR